MATLLCCYDCGDIPEYQCDCGNLYCCYCGSKKFCNECIAEIAEERELDHGLLKIREEGG